MTLIAFLSASSTAFATNGMNLEGYGAKSHALGGTSMAYDTGNSAVMNNPATLGMMEDRSSEIGIGIRGLHPDVTLQVPGISAGSDGDAYYMPSLSYMRRDGAFIWGVAVLAQGGMGTEYGENSSLFSYGNSMMGSMMVPLSGEDIRSEVGVGRLMFPLAYKLTENTTIGASLDFLWASMDLRMDMDGSHFAAMTMGQGGSVGGSMLGTLGGMIGSGMVSDIDYVRYDFSNDNAFLGEAIGYGTGFKVGFTHRFGKLLTVGGSYHLQSRISDLETSNAVLSFSGTGDAFSLADPVSVKGTIKVRNFEWPATFAAGLALYPAERWMIAADVRHIDWSSVMRNFSTSFTADNSPSNGAFAGQQLDVEMLQNWKDQTVLSIGVQYRATDRLALRTGASFASNPVPDTWLNPLFPAITENHYTAGFGYSVSERSSISAALAWAPVVTRTNADGLEISHGQLNWSINYTQEL